MSDPGAYDRLVKFVSDDVTGRTERGGPLLTEVVVATAWAKKTDASDRERIAAQSVGASITARFLTYWTRALADLDPRARIHCGGRIYDITGVKEVGPNDELEFTATARADTPKELA